MKADRWCRRRLWGKDRFSNSLSLLQLIGLSSRPLPAFAQSGQLHFKPVSSNATQLLRAQDEAGLESGRRQVGPELQRFRIQPESEVDVVFVFVGKPHVQVHQGPASQVSATPTSDESKTTGDQFYSFYDFWLSGRGVKEILVVQGRGFES